MEHACMGTGEGGFGGRRIRLGLLAAVLLGHCAPRSTVAPLARLCGYDFMVGCSLSLSRY